MADAARLPMEEIAGKYLAGVSANQLGAEYGVSHSTIKLHLRYYGIELRSQQEAIRVAKRMRCDSGGRCP